MTPLSTSSKTRELPSRVTASTDTNNASVSVTAGSYQDLAGNAGATGSTAAFAGKRKDGEEMS